VRKVVIILSGEAGPSKLAADADCWVMEGVLSESAIEDLRSAGMNVTIFKSIEMTEQSVSEVVSMALLHNQDWRETTVLR